MPFNGSGVYSLPSNSASPAVANTTIASADFNSLTSDFETAFNSGITQSQDGSLTYAVPTTGDAADAYVVLLTPAITSYATGLNFRFKAAYANTGASTININSLGIKNILTKSGGSLNAGAIVANGIYELTYDGTQFILSDNPVGKFVTGAGSYSSTTSYTLSTPSDSTWTTVGTGQWAALSSIPADADWIEVKVTSILALSPTTVLSQQVYAVATGQTQTADVKNFVMYSQYSDAVSNAKTLYQMNTVKIPVASRSFDIYVVTTATATNSGRLILTGYGYN